MTKHTEINEQKQKLNVYLYIYIQIYIYIYIYCFCLRQKQTRTKRHNNNNKQHKHHKQLTFKKKVNQHNTEQRYIYINKNANDIYTQHDEHTNDKNYK